MALESSRFAGHQRLQDVAQNRLAIGAFSPHREAVGLIQTALRDLNDGAIGRLPGSFKDGVADGVYGQETLNAVRQFQGGCGLKPDGVCGTNTLHALDEQFLGGGGGGGGETPPAKSPPPTEESVKTFLTGQPRDRVIERLINAPENLIVWGDFHLGEAHKSAVLERWIRALALRRPHKMHFHASEYLFPEDRDKIDAHLEMPLLERVKRMFELPPHVLRFLPVISAAADFPNHRYAILSAGRHVRGESRRHRMLFRSFQESIAHFNATHAAKINVTCRGNFLVGARHAARFDVREGRSGRTTTRRLIDAGWTVHVIRVVVDIPFLMPNDKIDLVPLDQPGGEPIHIVPMLTQISGGRTFYVDIRGQQSPFSRLMFLDPEEGKPLKDIAYNEMYDAFLYIPLTTRM